ncbi:hypothetical protein B0H16DRAFT_1520551 [Mycena metata]|uniref:Uncharacterized protein n=1 Tax=Mycena metata TaxID=1033252 RepID=A0AAD7JR05_9AGAR|nr:hypothetical protein B0H16DRAFT_1520551 [Mycena metata]
MIKHAQKFDGSPVLVLPRSRSSISSASLSLLADDSDDSHAHRLLHFLWGGLRRLSQHPGFRFHCGSVVPSTFVSATRQKPYVIPVPRHPPDYIEYYLASQRVTAPTPGLGTICVPAGPSSAAYTRVALYATFARALRGSKYDRATPENEDPEGFKVEVYSRAKPSSSVFPRTASEARRNSFIQNRLMAERDADADAVCEFECGDGGRQI